jgi:peroxiredoxin
MRAAVDRKIHDKIEASVKWFRSIFGGNDMAALTAGTPAPDFKLQTMDEKQFSLRDALMRGPVVAAFFKISCPVCQYAFPFLERIYKAHGGKNVTIVGVSQNEKKDTVAFVKEYGLTFPMLLDDTKSYPTSNAYGLTNVPSIFWIAQDGEIEISSVGWDRKEIEEINQKAAKSNGDGPNPVFRADEQVPDFRAG